MAETKPAPTQKLKTYYGNCHCGAFKFNARLPELKEVTECNCSICFKKGYKWVFPAEGCFTIEKGEGTLKDYEFGQKTMAHKFCSKCGTGVQGKRHGAPAGRDIGVNVRTLRDVDLWSLKVNSYDGSTREPQYNPPAYTGPEPSAQVETPKIYTGACHCGAVTLALKTKGPLPQGHEYIQECDCSICSRNGTTLVYPHPSQVSIANESALTAYKFGPGTQNHKFCPTCGVSVYIERLPISEEDFNKWHTSEYKNWMQREAVNLRCFEAVEWGSIDVKRAFWSNSEPKYVSPE